MKIKWLVFLATLGMSCMTFGQSVTSWAVPRNLHIYSTSGSTFVDHVVHGCAGARYKLSGTHPKYDALFSMLMAAQLADRRVALRYNGCGQGDIIGVYLE